MIFGQGAIRCHPYARAEIEAIAGTMVRHLEQIVEQCHAAGAEPVLLDYPFRDLAHEQLVDGVAGAKRARRVPLRVRFDHALASRPRGDLFIEDDVHCNDKGYALMAEVIADALVK